MAAVHAMTPRGSGTTVAIEALVRAARKARRRLFLLRHDVSTGFVEIRLEDSRMIIPVRYVEHYVFRRYEPLARSAVRRFLRPGMVVVDVGAHIGSYTVLSASAVNPGGHVHAIEPWPENIELLARNVELNQLTNVTIHRLAAGGRAERRTLHVTGASDSHGFFEHPLTDTVQRMDIEVRPIAELVAAPIDLAKIDVEGAELEVLEGMDSILESSRRLAVLIELNPGCLRSAHVEPGDLFAHLAARGFTKIVVLDDHRRAHLSPGDALAFIQRGAPEWWYANIWAERG